jgi:hypothetical protein
VVVLEKIKTGFLPTLIIVCVEIIIIIVVILIVGPIPFYNSLGEKKITN